MLNNVGLNTNFAVFRDSVEPKHMSTTFLNVYSMSSLGNLGIYQM